MTDDKKPEDEFDWDAALSEWEKSSFEPEVAKDKETQRPAVLESTPAAPIYKPPPLKVPNIEAPGTAADDKTKVGTIPKGLRQPGKPPALPPRPGQGGLGQLWGKSDAEAKPPPKLPAVPTTKPASKPTTSAAGVARPAVPPNLPPPRKEQATISSETDDALLDAMLDDKVGPPSEHPSIVTSADVPSLKSLLPEEPLKRPARPEEEPIAEGEMFDPFVDPESKRAEKRDQAPTAPPPPLGSKPNLQAAAPAKPVVPPAAKSVPRPPPSVPRAVPRPPTSGPKLGVPPAPRSGPMLEIPKPSPSASSLADAPSSGDLEKTAEGETADEPKPAPPLLQPEMRVHDPDSVTSTMDTKDLELSTALEELDKLEGLDDGAPVLEATAGELEIVGEAGPDEAEVGEASLSAEEEAAIAGETSDDDEEATAMRNVPELPPLGEEDEEEEETKAIPRPMLSSLPPAPSLPGDLDAERPAAQWLESEGKHVAMDHRATWLEEEARALDDKAARARGLLVVSELRAMLGQNEAALVLAKEACQTWPQVALAHRQLRGLLESRDAKTLTEAIDAAAISTSTAAASVHEALFAADVARIAGDEAALRRHLEDASTLAPHDVRVRSLQAALALSKGDLASAALHVGDDEDPVARAAADAAAIRGATGEASTAAHGLLALRRARGALARGELGAASEAIGELAAVSDFEGAATWLATALAANDAGTRARASVALKPLAAADSTRQAGDARGAARTLAARGIERADADTVHAALEHASAFSASERLLLRILAGDDPELVREEMSALASSGESALLAAAASLAAQGRDHHFGNDASKRAMALGHLLGHGADVEAVEPAVDARMQDSPPEMKMMQLDIARRRARWTGVASALSEWGQEGALERGLAAALVAERANEKDTAIASYRAAYSAYPGSEVALRPLASLDSSVDLAAELAAVADAIGQSTKSGILRIEATLRAATLDDATKKERFDRAHEAAPTLPIASFLAERYARRLGSIEDVLRYVRARRSATNDPIEAALDAIREALLVVDTDPALAATRLEEAHHARPDDFALRELYERLAVGGISDRGAWREKRAEKAPDDTKALLLLEAAYDYERTGDFASALRAASAARAARQVGIEAMVLERAEIRTGNVGRLADELLARARSASDATVRREAYERLSELDATARNDLASALLWHKTILEDFPQYKPSLRYVEHALLGEGRDEELEPVAQSIARALAGTEGGEAVAHAALSARLKMRAGDWDGTREMAELARAQQDPPLWALRLVNAHARALGDHQTDLDTTMALLDRSTKPVEIVTLLLRAADAGLRLGKTDLAKEMLERATATDPGDVSAWEKLARVRRQALDASGAAEAFESVARTSAVKQHQLDAWYDAALVWLDTVKDVGRGIAALEQIVNVEVTYRDVFSRLSSLYAARGARAELAALLERRVGMVNDPSERIGLEVERGRVLAEAGDNAGARAAFEAVLEREPDNVPALTAHADLSAKMADWSAAEKAWVQLARLLATPEEQRAIYTRLGELYLQHEVNLSRAETSFKEVLKRAPDDLATMEKLIEVYKRANDAGNALNMQQQLISRATDPADRRKRLVELSSIYETTSHDLRKAEQALETARREYPTDVMVLRALAEFYTRHRQMPAVHILLDRAAAEARRSFAAGRFMPALFEVMAAVYDIRGKKDASRAVLATLAALNGAPSQLQGAESRAGDPRLDEVLAPDVLTPALRALLARAGDALDGVFPLDPRALQAQPLNASAGPVYNIAQTIASGMQIPGLQVFVSRQIGPTCLPIGSAPPAIVLGEQLMNAPNPLARTFLIARALKLVQAHASALLRVPPNDLPVLIAAWLQVFNPSWVPQGLNPAAVADAVRRIQAVLPRRNDPDAGLIALEVAGSLGNQAGLLGPAALAWADRTGLLAVGDMGAALDGMSWVMGMPNGAPKGPAERAAWIGRTPEAKELVIYSVSDSYAEARMRAGLGR